MDPFCKISPASLCQRGVIPPFGKGRSGGIFGEPLDYDETIIDGFVKSLYRCHPGERRGPEHHGITGCRIRPGMTILAFLTRRFDSKSSNGLTILGREKPTAFGILFFVNPNPLLSESGCNIGTESTPTMADRPDSIHNYAHVPNFRIGPYRRMPAGLEVSPFQAARILGSTAARRGGRAYRPGDSLARRRAKEPSLARTRA